MVMGGDEMDFSWYYRKSTARYRITRQPGRKESITGATKLREQELNVSCVIYVEGGMASTLILAVS